MLQVAALLFFPALMVFAGLSDLLTMTISNRISIALVAIFIPFALLAGLPPAAIGLHLACGMAVLALTFTFFALGWVGGGDAKLAAATAVWIGWDHLADYGLQSAMLGGGLTLLILYARKLPLPGKALDVGWLARLHHHETGIPYGIALSLAGLLIYPDTGLWNAAA